MRIGIDARAAAEEPGGRGRYVRELLRHFPRDDHELILYGRRPWQAGATDNPDRWRIVEARDGPWHFRVARLASRECDVFLSTNSYLTPVLTRASSLAVIYDLIPFHRDYLPRRRSALVERATLPAAVRRCTALIAISSSTCADLLARFPRAASKTRVIPLAADRRFSPSGPAIEPVLERLGVERPYVLVTGTLEPRKNLPRLIGAFSGMSEKARAGRRLVIVGAEGWALRETEAAIGGSSAVQALGYVSDGDLAALYRGADLFCFPSLYEGFGLPVLEAMATGTPVIASSAPSMTEIAGDAALYFDPRDIGGIRATLEQVLSDSGVLSRLSERGLAQASQFSWRRTAEETLAALEDCLK
jgi:alpha-1,3-rhamnosyl/mannosyltransferase